MDRFNLEESIMSCWNTKDDIELLAETFSNKEMSDNSPIAIMEFKFFLLQCVSRIQTASCKLIRLVGRVRGSSTFHY
jgi:hypothetical protein